MKIAVIGASGTLGSIVTKQALDRGIAVKGFIRSGEVPDTRAEIVRKNLFDLTKGDLADCDVMISTYGSGLRC